MRPASVTVHIERLVLDEAVALKPHRQGQLVTGIQEELGQSLADGMLEGQTSPSLVEAVVGRAVSRALGRTSEHRPGLAGTDGEPR
jgi:hypothetical protein